MPGGRREANKERMRAALHDAAVSLFIEKGYDDTTVAEIADRAGTSPRTFFNYFASKEDVIFERAGRADALGQLIRNRPPSEGPREAVTNGILQAMSGFEQMREDVWRRNQAIRSAPVLRGRAVELEQAWQESIAEALASRARRKRPSAADRVLAAATVAVLGVSMREWSARPSGPGLPATVAANLRALQQVFAVE